jgi:hypothetical protein
VRDTEQVASIRKIIDKFDRVGDPFFKIIESIFEVIYGFAVYSIFAQLVPGTGYACGEKVLLLWCGMLYLVLMTVATGCDRERWFKHRTSTLVAFSINLDNVNSFGNLEHL